MNTLQERIAELFNGEMPSDDEIIKLINTGYQEQCKRKIAKRLGDIVRFLTNPNNENRHSMVPDFWWNPGHVERFHLGEDGIYHVTVTSHTGRGESDQESFSIPNSWVVDDDWQKLIKDEIEAERVAEINFC